MQNELTRVRSGTAPLDFYRNFITFPSLAAS